jgi:2-polyprenyl-6-hydroxyphenyl methylase/3-demethylubiquinone-9 3-methyltransferase
MHRDAMSTLQAHKEYYERYWTENRAGYSGDSQGYATNFRNWMHSELRDLPHDATILEVGCGDGAFTKDLARHSANVTAIDLSAQQIELNARAYPDVRFLQHDVSQRLPFADDTFGVIWCSEVLEHLFDPGLALREMFRVMAPGGSLLVTVPYHGRFKNVLIALFKWDEHFAPTHPHIRFFTRNTLTRLAAHAGFKKIQTAACGMNKPIRDWLIATNLLLKATKPGRPGH